MQKSSGELEGVRGGGELGGRDRGGPLMKGRLGVRGWEGRGEDWLTGMGQLISATEGGARHWRHWLWDICDN